MTYRMVPPFSSFNAATPKIQEVLSLHGPCRLGNETTSGFEIFISILIIPFVALRLKFSGDSQHWK
jgi:hypothetical protein